MGKKMTKEQLEIILAEIKRLEVEHPKANVIYNVEERAVQIIYPLPEDFYKLKDFSL